MIGIADPSRTEAIAAVAAARAAGITTVMITGDHLVTARVIARELGILSGPDAPGDPLQARVHARATPEDKIRIVREWQARGAVVAMTGDGVNDAPALRGPHRDRDGTGGHGGDARGIGLDLAGMIDTFRYLKVSLAPVLMVVGAKMMTHVWLKSMVGPHFNLYLLAVVLLILAGGVVASLLFSRRQPPG